MSDIRIFTIGFTKKTAKQFLEKLKRAGVKRVVDVRLNNVSQLAGFAKKDGLKYFLKEIDGIDYVHLPDLAPIKDILDAYKKHKGDWKVYEEEFLELIERRHIEVTVPKELVHDGCLLCSEDKPHHCHRRLVAEYLRDKWGDVSISHLV
jgi:uncharacterized protein (DUF488 family)